MSPNAALQQRLISLLDVEATHMCSFLLVLEEEHQILSQADVEPLFALAEKKNEIARVLSQLATRRAALLAEAGLPNDRQGIETLLGNPQHAGWLNFIQAATQARDLNQLNGKLTIERLKNNHQALALLMSSADAPSIYGPDGQTHTRPGSRLFGRV